MFFYNNPYVSANFTPRLPQHQDGDEVIYDDHDADWDYKIVDGVWQTRKKGEEGDWTSLEGNEEAVNKLNTKYPDAVTSNDNNDNNENNENNENDNNAGTLNIDEANQQIGKTNNLDFKNPESGTILDTIGDNPFLSLIHAVGTTINSFKGENYYDPGSKEDYMKLSITNPTNEDLYVNPTQFEKSPNKPWKYLEDQEQVVEREFQTYLDDRHERNPDKYGKVENFDSDLYEKTGHLEYKDGPGQGDLIEGQFPEATHLNWNVNPETGQYTTAHSYMQGADDNLPATQFNIGDGNFQAHQYPTPEVNTQSTDLSEDADGDGVPDYLTPTQKYGSELPKAQSSISDILLRNQDLSVLENRNESSESSESTPLVDVEGLTGSLYNDPNYSPLNYNIMSIPEINAFINKSNKRNPDDIYPNVFGQGYPNVRNTWDMYDMLQEYEEGEYIPQSAFTTPDDMHLLEYINKDFGSKGYQQRLRIEIERDLSTKEGWDLLPEYMKNQMIDFQANKINLDRYHMARSTPITYTKDDHPGTGGTRWYGEKDSTGFIALDQNTGDDTVIHEIYHGVTGSNKGMIGSTYDLLYNAKNKDDDNKISQPYFGDPTEVYVRKKLTEDWMREIGMWDSTSGDPYTKKMQKKIRKMIDKGDAPDFVVEFFGDGELLPGVYNKNEPELNRIIPEDLAIEIMNTVAFEDEIQDDMDDGISQDAYAKYGGGLPKAQKGNESIMIMGDVARANEAGLDTEYSDLRGDQNLTPDQAELVGGFAPILGEIIDGKNVLKSIYEGNYGDAALHALGFAIPIVPGKAVKKSFDAGWDKVKGWWRGADDAPYQKMFDDRTVPVRGGVQYDDGIGEYNSLKSMHKLYPDNIVEPLDLIMDDGVAVGYNMKNIPGEDLMTWTKNNKFSQEMYDEIANVIDDLNSKGLYHGDLNAQNIIIDNSGNWKIIDPVGFEHSSSMSEELLGKIKGLDSKSLEDLKRLIKKYGGSLPKAQYSMNLDNSQSQGILGSENSGYNPLSNITLDNNISNANFSNYSVASNVNDNMVPPEGEPFYNINDQLYASTQNVARTQEKWDAFNADFNERLQNPSLSMLDTKTSPLSTPSLDQDLLNQTQRISDMSTHRDARLDGRTFTDDAGNQQVVKSTEQMQESIDESNAKMQEIVDNVPDYEGTQEALDDLKESERLGFDSREEYKDFENQQQEEELARDLRTDQIKEANKDNQPSTADKLWNLKNRALDSKAGQTFSKIGAGAVRIAKPLNKIFADAQARKQKANMMQNAYLTDNMVAATDSDITGSKGNYDANTGIFRPDDKVVAGTTGSASYGTELQNFMAQIQTDAPKIEIEKIEVASIDPNSNTVLDQIARHENPATKRQMDKQKMLQARVGGEAEIDMNTYKQLIAAGAQIEIL
jgi:hypothetical protein